MKQKTYERNIVLNEQHLGGKILRIEEVLEFFDHFIFGGDVDKDHLCVRIGDFRGHMEKLCCKLLNVVGIQLIIVIQKPDVFSFCIFQPCIARMCPSRIFFEPDIA